MGLFTPITKEQRERYNKLLGKHFIDKFDKIEWVLFDFNDLGIPYFHKFVNGKEQTTSYTWTGFDVEKELSKLGM